MKAKYKFIISIFLLTLTQQSEALVNPHQGSFELDLSSDLKLELPFSLHYSSRSLYDGLYGRGWCSSFEYKLKKTKEEYQLIKCDRVISLRSNQVEIKKNSFWIRSPGGELLGFNTQGRVIFHRPNQKSKAHSLKESSLNFTQKNNLLTQIGVQGSRLDFTYDTFDNLKTVTVNDKPIFSLLYQNEKDLLLQVRDHRNQCTDNLKYHLRQALRLVTEKSTHCKDKVSLVSFVFEHRRNPAGQLILTNSIAQNQRLQ